MKKIIYSLTLMLFIGALMFVSSCKKEDKTYGNATTDKEQAMQNKIKALIRKLPMGKVGDHAGRYSLVKREKGAMLPHDATGVRDGGWDFTDPGGINYSSNNGITYSEATTTFYISPSSFGQNGGSLGGTVVAGGTSLDINYAFCFVADNGDQAVGGDLFSATNASTNGLSGVIGVSGDFDLLQNSDTSTDFSDIFHGIAFYFVYDGTPSGNYDVINWTDVDWNDTTSFDNKCFAFIFDFVNGRLFLSSSGHINVSGGSMTYNGEYLEVSGFLNDEGEYDLTGELEYHVVPGFGTMGCN
jgi:hypothetical protein